MTTTRLVTCDQVHTAPVDDLAALLVAAVTFTDLTNIRIHVDLSPGGVAAFDALRAAVRKLEAPTTARRPLPERSIGTFARPAAPTVREVFVNGPNHYENCPIGAPDGNEIKWVCDHGDHWIAWEIPAAQGDRCPVVMHEAGTDGRCYGTLSRPECICGGR